MNESGDEEEKEQGPDTLPPAIQVFKDHHHHDNNSIINIEQSSTSAFEITIIPDNNHTRQEAEAEAEAEAEKEERDAITSSAAPAPAPAPPPPRPPPSKQHQHAAESFRLVHEYIRAASAMSPKPFTTSPTTTTDVVLGREDIRTTDRSVSAASQSQSQSQSWRPTPASLTGSDIAYNATTTIVNATPCSSSHYSNQAVYTPTTPSESNVGGVERSSTRITLNPLFESASFVKKKTLDNAVVVKKKIITRLRSLRGEESGDGEENEGDQEGNREEHETKSLSIDSYYITPTVENEEEEAEKMIQASNYFIATALTAAFFVSILIIWLLAGLTSNNNNDDQFGGSSSKNRGSPSSTTTRYCVPLRAGICHRHRVGYTHTSLPNSLGHYNQEKINQELMHYDKLMGVKCYTLLPLFLCSIYAPKCIPSPLTPGHGKPILPCRSLCREAVRKCDFFLKVFTLEWPSSRLLDCDSLPDSPDPEVCVGFREHQILLMNLQACSQDGFRCDASRCLPRHWVCDGFIDCDDASDEKSCSYCSYDEYHCGSGVCIRKEDICDGIKDCPDGRDERQCLRLNKKMGSTGEGKLEAWSAVTNSWSTVCGDDWDSTYKSNRACIRLGYRRANQTWIREESPGSEFSAASNAMSERSGSLFSGITANDNNEQVGKVIKNPVKTYFNKGSNSRGCEDKRISVHLSCTHFECGRTSTCLHCYEPTSRIVGGEESLPGTWPWLVGLHGGSDQVFFCGGILINEYWVLSAAHCVGNQTNVEGWTIHLGLTRRTASPIFVRTRKVSTIIRHEHFDANHLYGNDIALLQLSESVNFDEFLRPICLPPPGLQLKPETRCTVVGWGRSTHDETTDYMDVVHEVEVAVVPHDTCAKWYALEDVQIGDTVLCAGYSEGEKDSCQGDSGGPLMCRSQGPNSHWFVAGIVSWGINCAQPNLPGIYTQVSIYRDWIKNVTTRHGNPVDV